MLTFVRGDTTKIRHRGRHRHRGKHRHRHKGRHRHRGIEITSRESEQSHEPSDILNSTPNNSNCSHHIYVRMAGSNQFKLSSSIQRHR